MEEFIAVAAVFGLILLLVTLVGHGIWVAVARLLRGDSPAPPTFRTLHSACPRCGTLLNTPEHPCYVCGWPVPGLRQPRAAAALAALLQQLDRYRQRGLLDAESYESLYAAVVAQRAAFLAEQPADSAPRAGEPTTAAPPPVPQVEPVDELTARPIAPGPHDEPPLAEPPPRGVAERVAAYAARQQETAEPLPPVPPPRERARPLTQILSAFMEEKNIRWGELVGGLLIVCCSIALVISFWAEIAERPLLKFVVFNGVTAGLFGVGFYTERRWKLRTTSLGLLVIGTLLVPLNILAIAAFSCTAATIDPVTLGGEVLSVTIFSGLLLIAGRTVAPDWPWSLTAAAMLPSIAQLLIRRFVSPEASLAILVALAAAAVAPYAGVTLRMLQTSLRQPRIDEPLANAMFRALGIATFAAALPLGLLLVKTQRWSETLHELSPVVAVVGLPALAIGLALWRRVTERELAALRVAGTSLSVLGVVVLLVGAVLAWPDAALTVPLALAAALMLVALAAALDAPDAHALAACAVAWALVSGGHAALGHVAWYRASRADAAAVMLSASTGVMLAPLAALYALVAAWWQRRQKPDEAKRYLSAASISVAASLALVTWYGFGVPGDPAGATWIYAIYCAAALAAALALGRSELVWVGSALLFAALAQAVVFRYAASLRLPMPWLTALLAHATITLAPIWLLRRVTGEASLMVIDTIAHAGLVACAAAVPLVALAVAWQSSAFVAMHLAWLAAAWLLAACLQTSPLLFAVFQLTLTLSVSFALTSQVEHRDWFEYSPYARLHPWHIQIQGIGLAGMCILWSVLRIAVVNLTRRDNSSEPMQRMLTPPFPPVDRMVAWLVLVGLVGLTAYGVAPGMAQELSPRDARLTMIQHEGRLIPASANFQWLGVPHCPAVEWGSWVLLGAVLAMLVATLWEQPRPATLLGMLVAASAAAPLVAGQWNSQIAVASALRWSSSTFFVVGSTAIWLRRPLASCAARLGWPQYEEAVAGLSGAARQLVLAIAIVPLAAMALFIAAAALSMTPLQPGVAAIVPWLAAWMLLAIVLAQLLRVAASLTADAADHPNAGRWRRSVGNLLLLMGMAPWVVVFLFQLVAALKQHPIVGPDAASIFARMGLAASYATPVFILALALIGHALRDRLPGYALAAGLLLNVSATGAFLLSLGRKATLDALLWLKVTQINAIVAAGYALLWVLLLAWRTRRDAASARGLVVTQVLLGIALAALIVVPAVSWLVIDPAPHALVKESASMLGWIAVALALVSLVSWARLAGEQIPAHAYAAALVGLGWMAAVASAHFDTGNWLAYHALMAIEATTAAGILVAGRLGGQLDRAVRWTTALGAMTVALALRALDGDPSSPWWSLGALSAVALLAVAQAWLAARRGFIYVGALLINLAASIWWFSEMSKEPVDLMHVNAVALAAPGAVWLLLELFRFRRGGEAAPSRLAPPHQLAAQISWALVASATALGLIADSLGGPMAFVPGLVWPALAATTAAAGACLWDARVRSAVAALYLLGLVVVGATLDSFDLSPRWLAWMGAMLGGAYCLATSYLWSRRAGLRQWADRLGIPRGPEQPFAHLAWLVPANCTLALGVVTLVFLVQLTFENVEQRVAAAQAAIAQAIALGMLARGERRSPLQFASLLVGVVGAVAMGWSGLHPSGPTVWLDRAVVSAAALAIMAILYGLGLAKLLRRENEWTAAAVRLTPLLVVAMAAVLCGVLAREVVLFAEHERAIMGAWAIATVAVTLGLVVFAALAAALLPGRDPLGLSERGRTAYVYAAEAVLGLLFLHVRLTMPWLFRGFFEQYWPLVVMGLAFLGVGLSELMRRQKRRVLYEPLENTGALLPMLPALGFWIVPPRVHYSVLLLAVGALYSSLAIARRSFAYAILAALAANGSLWYLLHHLDGLGLAEHPQLWLIPPALCVLAGSYLNRRHLSEPQMASTRYLAAITTYVSSTADIFLNGVARAPWLPLVLAGISLLGIFAGILLKVRAFLFLGISFLVLALMTVIWHAAVDLDQTWLWWVSGIVAGVLIIALFAVFEKKRDEVLRLVEQLKDWNA